MLVTSWLSSGRRDSTNERNTESARRLGKAAQHIPAALPRFFAILVPIAPARVDLHRFTTELSSKANPVCKICMLLSLNSRSFAANWYGYVQFSGVNTRTSRSRSFIFFLISFALKYVRWSSHTCGQAHHNSMVLNPHRFCESKIIQREINIVYIHSRYLFTFDLRHKSTPPYQSIKYGSAT